MDDIIYMVIVVIAHIIPQVYLKSWCFKNQKNSVYVFDKYNLKYEIKNLNTLKNTNFQNKDEYFLNIQDCCLEIYSELFESLYSSIKVRFAIQYKNIYIDSAYKFRNCCRYLDLDNQDNWIITDLTNNNRYGYRSFREQVIRLWNDNYQNKIEIFFSKNYETHWLEFLDYINKLKTTDKEKLILINDNQKNYLFEFLAVQLTRKFTNFSIFKQVIEYYMSAFGLKKEMDDYTVKKLWISNLFKYIQYKENNNSKYEKNLINMMIDYLNSKDISFEIYFSKDIDFLTSDNPIFRIESSEEFDYIYFPLNRKSCLAICSKSAVNNMFNIKTLSDIEVKIINDLIIKNSEKNFISYNIDLKKLVI